MKILDENTVIRIPEATQKGYAEATQKGYAETTQKGYAETTQKGYAETTVGDSIDINYLGSKTRRGRVGKGEVGTLMTTCSQVAVTHSGVRKLTPREYWRLMGFDDEDFDKAQTVSSDTQLYKQAGNSIVVNVLEAVLSQLHLEDE